ncbi:MAG: response regulator, partial [Gemmatimonadales bacterium]
MTSAAIKVLVADDHTVVREGIRHILERAAGFSVVAEAATGADALRLAVASQPDVAVLDVSMPGMSGLKVAAELRREVPEARVLILSMYDNPEYVLEAVRAGAHGYILKDSAATDLRKAVEAVNAGDSFFSPVIARRLSEA